MQFIMSFATPRLMRWTSARTASVSGLLITGLGCLMSIHLNPDAAYHVTVPSLIVRGIGQSLVVVALGVMAIQGLEKDQVGSASRLFSMVRNIGGAIGIGLSSQIVVEREKLHAQRIGESVTSFAQATQERLVETVNRLSHVHLDHATALYGAGAARLRQQALGLIDQIVRRDALLQAYSDAFYIAGLAMLTCVLAGLFLRKNLIVSDKTQKAALQTGV
ncbi:MULTISPECIES: hypothetical protein [Yersiniaceae]|uniref:hypothetical protein n=1 Tax=Yersiniaceae TaxID=1903411 RepID=UPI002FDE99D4